MKKITFFVAWLLLMCFSVHSQVQVGFGTTVSQNIPFSPGNAYSYAQSIYLASEINASGDINSIQWYYTGYTPLTKSQQLTVYLGTVPSTKTAFSSKSDWVKTGLTQVYSGGITTGSQPGWVTINLPTPFHYNGVDNLVVAAHENLSGNDDLNTDRFRASAYTGARSIYINSSSTDPDPASPPTATNTSVSVANIIFGGITQACATPTYLTSSDITSSTATVSWTSTTDFHSLAGCDYYIFTSNVPPTSSTAPTKSVGAGTSASITGLDPNTAYYLWVRNNCGNGLYSNWSEPVSFTTLCLPRTDFEEYFDLVTTPNLPGCWTKILKGDSITGANVRTSGINSYTGANSMEILNGASVGTFDVIAVSPLLSNLGDKTHRLRFYAKGEAGTLEIGSLDMNTVGGTFKLIETISGISTNYAEFVVDFSKYNVTGQYIGIRLNGPIQTTINLDNVIWEKIPGCPNVTDLNVPQVSYNSATIGWAEAGTESSWDIAVGSFSESDPKMLPFTNTEDSGSFLVTGLASTTKYRAWVRTVCDTDKGSWIGPVEFTTSCEPLAAFFEDFESVNVPSPATGPKESAELPYCWSTIIRQNSGVIDPLRTKIVTSRDMIVLDSGSEKAAYLTNAGSTGNIDVILVTPPLSSLQLKNHRLKFFCIWEGSIEIGTLNSNTMTANFTPYKTVPLGNGVAEYIVDFSQYTGDDHFIGFRIPNGGKGTAIDNITWEEIPACPEISNVAVVATTTSTATVKWSPSVPGNESSWDVVMGGLDANPDGLQLHNVSTASQPTFTFSGLDSGTTYKVWARANCPNTATKFGAWVGPVLFTTECPPVASFYETFDTVTVPNGPDEYTTPSLPSCWTKIMRASGTDILSIYATVTTSSLRSYEKPNFTAPNFAMIEPQGSGVKADVMLVSPSISTLGQAYRLKFDYFYGATIAVGVVDGNTPSAKFYKHAEFTVTEADGYKGGRMVIDFTNYSGAVSDYNHIAIKVSGAYARLAVDNITWERVPNCPDIASKIKVSATSPTTATVQWDKAANETGWEVSIHPNNPDAANSIHKNVSMMAAPSALVSGLTPNTTYFVWVRSICGTGGLGAWGLPTKFVTPCLAFDIPYKLDFEEVTLPAMPACTDSFTDSVVTTWQTSAPAPSLAFPTKYLRYSEAQFDENAWFFTGGVNLVQGVNYKISYLKGNSNTQDNGFCSGVCGGIDFSVMYGTSPTVDGMSNTLKVYNSLFGTGAPDEVSFTVPTSGVYYFGFHNFSVAPHGRLMLDDILVDTNLSGASFDLSKLAYYPNPVKDVLNISNSSTISRITVCNVLGQAMLTKTIDDQTARIDMSSLSNGAYIVRVFAGDSIKAIKIIKE